jgi:hypothetical protein
MPWSETARADAKIEILHQQADELRRRLDDLRTRFDGDINLLQGRSARPRAVLQAKSGSWPPRCAVSGARPRT